MAVAAAARYPRQHVLVIGAGTCITFDLVQAGGTYMGGSISPAFTCVLKHSMPLPEDCRK